MRKQFKRTSGKRGPVRAKKVSYDGIDFASGLEKHMYVALKNAKIVPPSLPQAPKHFPSYKNIPQDLFLSFWFVQCKYVLTYVMQCACMRRIKLISVCLLGLKLNHDIYII